MGQVVVQSEAERAAEKARRKEAQKAGRKAGGAGEGSEALVLEPETIAAWQAEQRGERFRTHAVRADLHTVRRACRARSARSI